VTFIDINSLSLDYLEGYKLGLVIRMEEANVYRTDKSDEYGFIIVRGRKNV